MSKQNVNAGEINRSASIRNKLVCDAKVPKKTTTITVCGICQGTSALFERGLPKYLGTVDLIW